MRCFLSKLFCISILTACSILIITYVLLTIYNSINLDPFSIEEEYVSIRVTTDNKEFSELKSINNKIKELLYFEDDVIVIKISEDYSKVFIYDPSCFLSKNFNYNYFTFEEFKSWKSNSIIIDKESPLFRMKKDNNLYVGGSYKKVIGTYSNNSFIKIVQNGCYTVETLSNDDILTGIYYIYRCNSDIIEHITSLFNEYNYYVSLNNLAKSNNFIIKSLINNIQVITMIPTILIIILTNFLTFCLLFSKIKRTKYIHYICGATDVKLFIHLFRETFTSIIFATIIGILIGSFVLYFSYTDLFYKYIFIAAIVNIVLLSMIMFLSYICNKKTIHF